MSIPKHSIKQISFDLDTEALKKYYPGKSWRMAYDDIKRFMYSKGFMWVQGSVYVSKASKSTMQISMMLSDLIKEYPWLHVCMRDCRETNISKIYNRSMMFDKTAKIPTREELEHMEKDGGNINLVREMKELEDTMKKLSMLLVSKELER